MKHLYAVTDMLYNWAYYDRTMRKDLVGVYYRTCDIMCDDLPLPILREYVEDALKEDITYYSEIWGDYL